LVVGGGTRLLSPPSSPSRSRRDSGHESVLEVMSLSSEAHNLKEARERPQRRLAFHDVAAPGVGVGVGLDITPPEAGASCPEASPEAGPSQDTPEAGSPTGQMTGQIEWENGSDEDEDQDGPASGRARLEDQDRPASDEDDEQDGPASRLWDGRVPRYLQG